MCCPLGFQHDALQFFEDGELFVGVINLGIALLFGDQEANFFEALEFALDVAGVFFDEFGQAADVGLEVGILGINNNNLAPDSGCNKYV